jgi:hypothetical protein
MIKHRGIEFVGNELPVEGIHPAEDIRPAEEGIGHRRPEEGTGAGHQEVRSILEMPSRI